jgi:tetratricopeptide (TPR) repeat protein
VSARFRRALGLGGPVLFVAGIVLAVARPGSSLAWALGGAGAALVLVARRTTASDRGCAFCGADRERVAFLVTGPSVSICPECAAAASAKTAEELDRRGQLLEWTRMFLGGLPERAPLSLSRPYVEMVVGSERSPEWIRASLACCFRFGHHRLAQELLEAIPEPARTPFDWINLGFALGEQGRHAEALAATRRGAAAGDETSAPWVLANGAWYELLLNPGASRDDLARWAADAVEARRLLTARPESPEGLDARRQAVASFLGIEAELLRRMGDPEAALRALDDADTQEPPTGERLVVQARALADLARPDEARACAERALAVLRPESRAAAEARRALDALPPAAGPAKSEPPALAEGPRS